MNDIVNGCSGEGRDLKFTWVTLRGCPSFVALVIRPPASPSFLLLCENQPHRQILCRVLRQPALLHLKHDHLFVAGHFSSQSPTFFVGTSHLTKRPPSTAANMCLKIVEKCSQCGAVTPGSELTKPCDDVAQMVGLAALTADSHLPECPLPFCSRVGIMERYEWSCADGCHGQGESGPGSTLLNQLLAEAEEMFDPSTAPISAPWTAADTQLLRQTFVDVQVNHYRRRVEQIFAAAAQNVPSNQSGHGEGNFASAEVAQDGRFQTGNDFNGANDIYAANDMDMAAQTFAPGPSANNLNDVGSAADEQYPVQPLNVSPAPPASAPVVPNPPGAPLGLVAPVALMGPLAPTGFAPPAAGPSQTSAPPAAGPAQPAVAATVRKGDPWTNAELSLLIHLRNNLDMSIVDIKVSRYSTYLVLAFMFTSHPLDPHFFF